MFLPGIKSVWVGFITFCATTIILFVATLVNILKLKFSKHMSLYCYILQASLHFGSKIIVPKLRLYSSKFPF
jgi:hypothetical protein